MLKNSSIAKPDWNEVGTFLDPGEDLDWRWQLIEGYIKSNTRPPRKCDKWVMEGWRFALAICSAKDNVSKVVAAKAFPALSKVITMRNTDGQSSNRWQALTLCSDLSLADQAQYLGVTPEVIVTYEKLFFDIRERRDNKGYLCDKLLTPTALQEAEDTKDSSIIWKMVAIFGGFDVVRVCWECQPASDNVMRYYYNMGLTALNKNFGVGNTVRPVNRYSIADVSSEVIKLADVEVKRQAISGMGGMQGDFNKQLAEAAKDNIEVTVLKPMEQLHEHREKRYFEKLDFVDGNGEDQPTEDVSAEERMSHEDTPTEFRS